MKKILAVLLALLLILGMTACGDKEDVPKEAEVMEIGIEDSKEEDKENTEEEKPEKEDSKDDLKEEIIKVLSERADEVEVTEDSVIFTDDSGRDKVEIKKNPQRVAVLYGSYTPLWIESGGKLSMAVGGKTASELYIEQLGRDVSQDDGVEVVAESSSGKTWDIEKILVSKPDLIICSTAMNGYSTIQGPAEAANIPIIALTYNGVADYIKWSKVFANINDKPEVFEEIAQKTLEDVAEVISKVPESKKPELLILFPQSKGIKANLKGTDLGTMVDDLKGINLADQMGGEIQANRVDINIEDIYAANPEIILVQCLESVEFAKEAIESTYGDNPIWAELDAIKNDKLYYMPRDLFHRRPNKLYNEAYKKLAEILYPDTDF